MAFGRLVLPGTLISFGSLVTFGFSTLQAKPKGEQEKSERGARVAIIGSGIGGSSAAHFVRQILGPDAEIEVFERSDKVGGRLATIEVAGNVYEAGGSIIHPENMYMKSFVKDLGKEELVNVIIIIFFILLYLIILILLFLFLLFNYCRPWCTEIKCWYFCTSRWRQPYV